MDPQALFDWAVGEIKREYAPLGHRLGWRFLLSPRRTFARGARTALLSFHPGGQVEYPPMPSVEDGSAYLVEQWGDWARGEHPLQVQVQRLLAVLGDRPDDTLAAYFVPFRAPHSDQLASPAASRVFAVGLWRTLLPALAPQVLLVLGADAFAGVQEVLGPPSREVRLPAGWGSQVIITAQFGEMLAVRLPHLSQFKLLSTEDGRAAVADVARRVAAFREGSDAWARAPEVAREPATTVPATMATLFEKAAVDNGFDHELARQAGWLAFASTHAPLKVWLGTDAEGRPVAALSRLDVAQALAEHGVPVAVVLPGGAPAARAVTDVPALHRLLRRAYQLARTLPNELLHTFKQQTAALPRATEAERLVVQRVGQNLFRAGLMDYWEGRCAITGLAVPELLRASHIKPWADCATDAERLDVFNGLLLAPHLDAAFDRGFITASDDGEVVVSDSLSSAARELLGLVSPLRVAALSRRHCAYLAWHRERVFTNA